MDNLGVSYANSVWNINIFLKHSVLKKEIILTGRIVIWGDKNDKGKTI